VGARTFLCECRDFQGGFASRSCVSIFVCVVHCLDTCQLARCIESSALGSLANTPCSGNCHGDTAVNVVPRLVVLRLVGAIVHVGVSFSCPLGSGQWVWHNV